MVVILLSFLLKWVPLYVRNGLILLMIIFYAMICGGDSSVVRATIMGCLTLIALFWGREVSIWRAMQYAFVLILLFNPFALVYDVGLLLSFSAIIGIVLFQKITEHGVASPNELDQKKKEKKSGFLQSKFWKEYLTPTI
jgi:competence protein ComEC